MYNKDFMKRILDDITKLWKLEVVEEITDDMLRGFEIAMQRLPESNRKFLEIRYGVDMNYRRTFFEIYKEYGYTISKCRNACMKGLHILRHPDNLGLLLDGYVGYTSIKYAEEIRLSSLEIMWVDIDNVGFKPRITKRLRREGITNVAKLRSMVKDNPTKWWIDIDGIGKYSAADVMEFLTMQKLI